MKFALEGGPLVGRFLSAGSAIVAIRSGSETVEERDEMTMADLLGEERDWPETFQNWGVKQGRITIVSLALKKNG